MKTITKMIYPAFALFAFACVVLSPMARATDGVLNLSDPDLLRSAPTFITFDVPGARSTIPFAINPAGLITGFWVDNVNRARHGSSAIQTARSLPSMLRVRVRAPARAPYASASTWRA